jgi:fructose-specific phosphotransferase system IIC component
MAGRVAGAVADREALMAGRVAGAVADPVAGAADREALIAGRVAGAADRVAVAVVVVLAGQASVLLLQSRVHLASSRFPRLRPRENKP